MLTLLILLAALDPSPDLEDDLKRAEKEMQEQCKSKTKLVFEWKTFDADPKCASSFPSLPQHCVNAAKAVAGACGSANVGAGTPASRKLALAFLPGLTELRCTSDKVHEAAAQAWLKAHPDKSGLDCPRNNLDIAEVFKDMQGHRYGIFTHAGTVLTFAFTIDAAAPEMYLEDQMKGFKSPVAPTPPPKAVEKKKPAGGW